MKFCYNCGKSRKLDSKFCENCGNQFDKSLDKGIRCIFSSLFLWADLLLDRSFLNENNWNFLYDFYNR